MSIQDAVADICRFQSDPPDNEANTCLWVIYPTLQQLGYAGTDIAAQSTDPAGNKPDYAVLRDSEHCWYLEAKAWNVTLTELHAAQASGYTYQSGKRWAVLTNGRVWRLFDAHEKEPANRLVCEAGIEDPQRLAELLQAISKEAVTTGKTQAFARRIRLHNVLSAQLRDERSPVMKSIVAVLKRLPEMETTEVRPGEVVAYLQGLRRPDPVEPDAPEQASEPAPAPPPPAMPARTAQETGDLLPIGSFEPSFTKPAAIALPGQAETLVDTWAEVACCAMKWLHDNHSIPLPFRPGRSRYAMLDAAPNGLRQPKEIAGVRSICYYDAHKSAQSIIFDITQVCRAVGVDPGTIRVRLRQQ